MVVRRVSSISMDLTSLIFFNARIHWRCCIDSFVLPSSICYDLECRICIAFNCLLLATHHRDAVHSLSSVLELGPDTALNFIAASWSRLAFQIQRCDFITTSEIKFGALPFPCPRHSSDNVHHFLARISMVLLSIANDGRILFGELLSTQTPQSKLIVVSC